MLIETLESNKTGGQTGGNCMRFNKFACCTFRKIGTYIFEKNHTQINTKDSNSNMHKHYSLLRNENDPDALAEKREVVLKHKQSKKNNKNECNKVVA